MNKIYTYIYSLIYASICLYILYMYNIQNMLCKYIIYDFFFKISFLSTYVNHTLISNEIKLKYFYNNRKI